MNEKLILETQRRIVLEEELLMEMAYPPSKVYDKIDTIAQDKLLDHLIFCFTYGQLEKYKNTIHHWAAEASSFLHKIWKINTTNKYPKKEDLIKNCLDTWFDCLDDWIPVTIKNYSKKYGKLKEYDLEQVKNKIRNYYEWLYTELSSKGELEASNIIKKIEDLSK